MKLIQFIRFVKTIIRILFGRGAVWLLFPTLASCQIGFFSAGAPKLLDEYSGASAAYSVHQLSNAATLAMQVRRASDNATADIGFDNGELNIGQIINHCSGTDCRVVYWYDQSGNNKHALNITTAEQPKIYDISTGIVYENGQPALQFDGTQSIKTAAQLVTDDNFSIYAIATGNTQSNKIIAGQHSGGSDVNRTVFLATGVAPRDTAIYVFFNNGSSYIGYHSAYAFDNSQKILISESDGSGETYLTVNGQTENVISGQTWSPLNTNFTIGAFTNNSNGFTGKIQTVIVYQNNRITDRTGINASLNNFFSIY